MNTLKTPIDDHVPIHDGGPPPHKVEETEDNAGMWFSAIVMLLLSIAGFYLLWAKVCGEWPFAR